MSPQLQHALLRVLLMIILAALGVVGIQAADIIRVAGVDATVWGPIVGAIIAGAVGAVEGKLDANRAKDGIVQESDVAFKTVASLAENPTVDEVYFLNPQGTEVRVPA